MYRKLMLSGVSIVALVTLVASAQQPVPDIAQSGQQPPANHFAPLNMPADDGRFMNMTPYYLHGPVQREEIEYAQKSEALVKQLAKAEGDKREKIKDQLIETLGKQFDARQKRHQADIKALEDKLKKLKDLVQKRQDNRREIISRRMEQLQREADGLGW